ncbi:MAG TPA: PAS domain S-box protein [Clostridia bacterium]|nr:PAS domain S-box protein [Clostridia bacterium]
MQKSDAKRKATVLVVEDESIVAMDIEQGLKKLGYAVVGVADSGELAVDLAERFRPDLVLMDIRLKGEMDGIQAGQQTHERWGIPIVFLTAHADEATLQRAKSSEPFGYVLKPFEERELHTAIEIALRKHNTETIARKKADEALYQSEESFRLLVESITDHAILMLNLEGRVVSWNKAAERMEGYTAEEIIGQHFSIFYPEKEQAEASLRVAQAQGRLKEQGWRIRKDGSLFWADVVISPLHDQEGRLRGFAKVVRDVTDRRRAEQALAESERKLRSILDGSPVIVFLKDLKGRNLFSNRGFQNVLNLPREDIAGKTDGDLFADEYAQAFRKHDRQIAVTGEPVQFEELMPHADGVHTYLSEKFPLRDSSGDIYAICGVSTDITERKRVEKELRRLKEELERCVEERTARLSETVEQLKAFSYTLSHDLRAPIRTIQSFTEIAREECVGKVDDSTLGLLDDVLAAGRRMDQLILDVLALTRVSRQDVRIEPLAVERIVREIVAERPELRPPHATVTIERPLLPALGHGVSLSQCLTNLLSNAVKFVPAGVHPRVRIHSEMRGSRVRLWIEDNGIGIPREEQQRIFNIFQRLHTTHEYEGTGIGLAIVRKASERMGGQVGVESEPGKGSRFWIELPTVPTQSFPE